MVVDMSKKTLFFFSEAVDNDTLDEIMAKGQKTVIQELEMMAVLAAVKSWHSFLKSRKDWQWVSKGFFPQDLVSQRQQRWHDQCHFWSGGGIRHSFVDRKSSESEQSLGRFVKRSGGSFWRSRKSPSEPEGNLEVAGQVISYGGHPRAHNGGESAAVGMSITANSPLSKKKRECACLQGFTVHGLVHRVTWQLA